MVRLSKAIFHTTNGTLDSSIKNAGWTTGKSGKNKNMEKIRLRTIIQGLHTNILMSF